MKPKLALLRAAQILDQDADDLRESHQTANDEWDTRDPLDVSAKAHCEECQSLAAILRLLAEAH